jgi:hypothetical protein
MKQSVYQVIVDLNVVLISRRCNHFQFFHQKKENCSSFIVSNCVICRYAFTKLLYKVFYVYLCTMIDAI